MEVGTDVRVEAEAAALLAAADADPVQLDPTDGATDDVPVAELLATQREGLLLLSLDEDICT